jgi:hypothetical protein
MNTDLSIPIIHYAVKLFEAGDVLYLVIGESVTEGLWFCAPCRVIEYLPSGDGLKFSMSPEMPGMSAHCCVFKLKITNFVPSALRTITVSWLSQ